MSVRTPSLFTTAAAAIALFGAASSFAAGVPAGEGEVLLQQPAAQSMVSRAEVRAAVLAAARAQALPAAGEQLAAATTQPASASQRADVRRDTAQALRTGQLIGAGEALAASPAAALTRVQ